MDENISKPRDYIVHYVEFQELRINAQSKLDLLLAEANSIIASQERNKALELEVKINNQRTYLGRIDKIINDWGNALAMLAMKYNKTEYEMFNTLIIKGVPPKNTKWPLQTCYNFKCQVYKELDKLTIKEK